jgi:hypothetical protein
MRFRVWRADATRALPALGVDGPLVVQPGEVVVVAVVADVDQALEVMTALELKPKHRGRK